jgi:hypothetical protein
LHPEFDDHVGQGCDSAGLDLCGGEQFASGERQLDHLRGVARGLLPRVLAPLIDARELPLDRRS